MAWMHFLACTQSSERFAPGTFDTKIVSAIFRKWHAQLHGLGVDMEDFTNMSVSVGAPTHSTVWTLFVGNLLRVVVGPLGNLDGSRLWHEVHRIGTGGWECQSRAWSENSVPLMFGNGLQVGFVRAIWIRTGGCSAAITGHHHIARKQEIQDNFGFQNVKFV